MKMNNNVVLFLDLDGVMCTTTQYYTNKDKWNSEYHRYKFDEKCVKVFNQIIEKTKPIIILSSDWKDSYTIEQLNRIFEINKVDVKIFDITPQLWGIKYFKLTELEECRANEILKYVEGHKIKKFIAIDDLDLSKWLPNNFIRTPMANEGIKTK
jgi:capsular polysaccharide biosynthesis protein